MGDSNERNDGDRPRQPRNLQGLLKFAMEGKKIGRVEKLQQQFQNNLEYS